MASVSVVFRAAEAGDSVEGVKTHREFLGSPAQLNVMAELKLLIADAVKTKLALWPEVRLAVVGVALTVKSGVPEDTVTAVEVLPLKLVSPA